MFQVTEAALFNLKNYMQQNNVDSAIRVALMQGGWAGPSLGLALDEPRENDTVYNEDGVDFLVDNQLMENCGEIKVDFVDNGFRSGFSIYSAKPVGGGGGGGCGSCGSSCG